MNIQYNENMSPIIVQLKFPKAVLSKIAGNYKGYFSEG